jgi:RNA polymerase sigma factor (sigma-70 family)
MNGDVRMTDAELVARCLKGDARAWELLIHRYKRLIFSIARKYQLTPDQAADVFQSVCLVMLKGLEGLKDHSKISSWLITTTLRECWKLKRRDPLETDPLEDEHGHPVSLPDESPLPDELFEQLEKQHLIRLALQRLPERCRRLLEMLFYEQGEWSYEQISRELGLPVASIGPTRGRCLYKLKKILADLGFRE